MRLNYTKMNTLTNKEEEIMNHLANNLNHNITKKTKNYDENQEN